MQMLEQLAEEEDDDDNGDEFYVSDGGNYAFNYDSPFDSCKDRGQVVAKLVTHFLSSETAQQPGHGLLGFPAHTPL